MRRLVFILIIMLSSFSLFGQQKKKDTNGMALSITNYFFANDMQFNYGDYTIGPTLLLRADKKFMIQFGLLIGVKKYTLYRRSLVGPYFSNYNGSAEFSARNIFVPLLFHYKLINANNFSFYLSAGIGTSGNYIVYDQNDPYDYQDSRLYLIAGLGISYKVQKHWMFRVYPTTDFILPGISVDVSYLFKSKILEP